MINLRNIIKLNIKVRSYDFIGNGFSIFSKMRAAKLEGIPAVYHRNVVVDAPTLENIVAYTHPTNQFMAHRRRIKRTKYNYAYANILRNRVINKLDLHYFLYDFNYEDC